MVMYFVLHFIGVFALSILNQCFMRLHL